jgi:hypothetical protein
MQDLLNDNERKYDLKFLVCHKECSSHHPSIPSFLSIEQFVVYHSITAARKFYVKGTLHLQMAFAILLLTPSLGHKTISRFHGVLSTFIKLSIDITLHIIFLLNVP